MADLVSSVAASTVGNVATEYVSPYVRHFFRFRKIVEDFKNQRKQLELKTDRVKSDVKEAIRQTELIERDVEDWLKTTEKELGEAKRLEAEIERSKCFSWCPNWGWRYSLSKKVFKKTLSISRLVETSNFPRVGQRVPLEGIHFLSSNDNFLPSESSKAAFSGIMEVLSCNGVCMIGLYGMPGVGKTTLAEQVGKRARDQKLFDKIMFLTVSQTPNIKDIQDKIADFLGLKFSVATEAGRAEVLLLRLRGEKKLLIIIDDVWDRLELKHIGIPYGDDHRGCKILLTTRRQQVCTQMNCQEKFQLDILSESEAWVLFEKNAGLENASPALIDVAEEVAKECKGLPLAIITMGRALKNETDVDGWIVVNGRLKDSRHSENIDVCGDIYRSIKISYDYLKGSNSRLCLLLCSLFPEDHEIGLEELTMYGVALGMFDDFNYSIEDARREMRLTITNLQKSGLLLETRGEFKMHSALKTHDLGIAKLHDVVRDCVHWMTWKSGENMMLVKRGLKEWPRIGSESLGCCTSISLIKSKINTFPVKLEFHKLKTFLLDDEKFRGMSVDRSVPAMFFQGMKVLTVLVLKNVSVSLEGLWFVPNLRTLHLEECVLGNVSCLGNLKKLEILVILTFIRRSANYTELFLGLTGLTTLRTLSIYKSLIHFGEAAILPNNLLSSLVNLEELHLTEYIGKESDIGGLSEVCLLSSLILNIFSVSIPKGFVFHPLKRYKIAVNMPKSISSFDSWPRASSRSLTVTNFSLNTFKKLFCNVEELILKDVMDSEYLIDTTKEQQVASSAFSNLVTLSLDNMICLKELCHGLPPTGFLHKLEHLDLVSLPELKSIWKGPADHFSLERLKCIEVSRCNRLKYIFSFPLARSLVHLQRLVVSDCYGVEQVFYCDKETDDGEDITLPRLHTLVINDLRSLRNLYSEINYFVKLPCLNNLAVRNGGHFTDGLQITATNDELETLDVDGHVYKKLFCKAKHLTLHGQMNQKSLAGEAFQGRLVEVSVLKLESCNDLVCLIEQLNYDGQSLKRLLPKLKELKVRNCNDMVSLLPATINLDKVTSESCGQMQSIFETEGGEDEEMLSDLKELRLKSLPELRCIWKGPTHHVNLQSLKVMTIKRCDKLTSLFSPSLAQTSLHLEVLRIQSCKELENIIGAEPGRDDDRGPVSSNILLPQLQHLVLEDLENLSCLCPRFCYVISPSLEYFNVRNCPKLSHNTWHGRHGRRDLKLYAFKEMICCSENLTLNRSNGCQNLIPDLDPEGLNELTFILLHNVANIESLYDTPEHRQPAVAFSNLVELVLEKVSGLKKLCNNRTPKGFLQKLEKLKITNCMDVASLSPVGENLKVVRIKNCCRLNEIFEVDQILRNSEANEAQLMSNLRVLVLESLPELRWIWKRLSLSIINLESLKIVRISNCKRLRCLFPLSHVKSLGNLEELILHDLPELEQLITKPVNDVNIEASDKEAVLPKFRILSLEKLPGLKSFIPTGYHFSFTQLSSLKVKECSSLTTSFSLDSNRTIHAKTEAVGDVAMEGSTTNVDEMAVSNAVGETSWPVGSDINWTLAVI